MTNKQIDKRIAKICAFECIPDCTDDLNACHEFEKTLTHINDWMLYDKALAETTEGFNFHATARQRCEAFLRVHGQWEETE